MPVFPQFAQRLAQMNNPMQRQPGQPDDGQQPMQMDMQQPSNIQNPMQMQQGQQQQQPMQMPMLMPRSKPMQRSGGELPAPSGTGGDAVGGATPARTMKTKIYENVAKEVRYEDIAPKMEVVPGMPPFQPKPGGGVWNHVKSAAQGFAGAAALSNNNPLAAIAGGVAGAIKPEMGQDMAYRGITVPKAQAQQKQVMGRNADRQAQFHLALQDRVAVNKMNEANQPEYGVVPGAENPTLFEKHSGEQVPVLGPDGKPQRAASVTNAETGAMSREDVARTRALDAAERAADKARHDFELSKLKFEQDKEKKEIEAKHRAEIEQMRQSGQDRRAGNAQAGADRRSKTLSDKSDREERKRKSSEPAPGVGEYGPIDLPPTSGTGKKSNRRQLPPPSGTSPN